MSKPPVDAEPSIDLIPPSSAAVTVNFVPPEIVAAVADVVVTAARVAFTAPAIKLSVSTPAIVTVPALVPLAVKF